MDGYNKHGGISLSQCGGEKVCNSTTWWLLLFPPAPAVIERNKHIDIVNYDHLLFNLLFVFKPVNKGSTYKPDLFQVFVRVSLCFHIANNPIVSVINISYDHLPFYQHLSIAYSHSHCLISNQCPANLLRIVP